jgi:hypothetical protein
MWGGRFSASPDAIMEEINASIDFDRHLFRRTSQRAKPTPRCSQNKASSRPTMPARSRAV